MSSTNDKTRWRRGLEILAKYDPTIDVTNPETVTCTVSPDVMTAKDRAYLSALGFTFRLTDVED